MGADLWIIGTDSVGAAIGEKGLVDVCQLDSTIQVRLMYARPDNFVGKVLYRELNRAYLLPETARHW